MGSTAMRTLAFWQSMNSFRCPSVSVINTGSIFCYMKVNFRTFKISWNTYLLNYLCWTWFYARHLIDSSVALFRSLWLFSMSMLSFTPNCWSHPLASQDLVWHFTLRMLMNAPKASCMTCAMQGIWFLQAGHLIAEASSVDCSSGVIK